MNALKNFLHSVDRKRRDQRVLPKIAVVGDGMVDEYYQITSERISPEFPIPVMLSSDLKPNVHRPGGAANVLYQLNSYPCKVDYYGFYEDYSKQVFMDAFDENSNINWNTGVFISGAIPIKRRLYHEDFPLIRWDIEQPDYGMSKDDLKVYRGELNRKFLNEFYDVVIISDYGKGMFESQEDIWLLGEEGPITIVDPKNGPLERWKGCSVFKPNCIEAEKLTGESDWERQAECIIDTLGCMAVVITCSGDGVVGQVGHRKFEYRPFTKVKASSVIGAGDCFASILALGLAMKHDIVDMVEVAFTAGTTYVRRKHNTPVAYEDLVAISDNSSVKFRTAEELAKEEDLVFTNGCFDIVHSGHIECLKYAKSLGEKLVVAVNTDESIKLLDKGDDRPIIPFEERIKLLSELECVDYVIGFSEETPQQIIEQIKPAKICKGGDYEVEDIVGADLVGYENVYIFDYKEGFSTTNIIDKIKSQLL